MNGDNICFQYGANVVLNYQEIEAHPERVSNIAQFIKKIQLEWNKMSVQIRRLEKVCEKEFTNSSKHFIR